MAKWKPSGKDEKEDLAKLKSFSEKWRQIGFVPFKSKDEINARYKKVLDEKYDSLNIDRNARQKIKLEQRIESLKDASNSNVLLKREKDQIRNKISRLQAEISTYENNMGFLANSKGAEKMKEEIERKIETTRKEISELRSQLDMFKDA